jgi:hypothetical protein
VVPQLLPIKSPLHSLFLPSFFFFFLIPIAEAYQEISSDRLLRHLGDKSSFSVFPFVYSYRFSALRFPFPLSSSVPLPQVVCLVSPPTPPKPASLSPSRCASILSVPFILFDLLLVSVPSLQSHERVVFICVFLVLSFCARLHAKLNKWKIIPAADPPLRLTNTLRFIYSRYLNLPYFACQAHSRTTTNFDKNFQAASCFTTSGENNL